MKASPLKATDRTRYPAYVVYVLYAKVHGREIMSRVEGGCWYAKGRGREMMSRRGDRRKWRTRAELPALYLPRPCNLIESSAPIF